MRLGKFLCTNYKQALTVLKSEAALRRWMRDEKIESDQVFYDWLKEEKAYLLGLKNASTASEETLEMEYVQRLVNLSASE